LIPERFLTTEGDPVADARTTAVDWEGGVSDAWTNVAEFIPKLAMFLVILLVGYVLARVLAKVNDAVLERVGFYRAVERGGIKSALARSKYDASDIVAKIVYYAVFLTALVMAFNVFGPNPVSDLLASVVAFLPKLVVALVIVVVAAAIARAVKDLITNMLGGLAYGRVLANIASVFILALGVIAALNQIEVATAVTTPVLIAVLATLGGIAVVGVGGGLIRPMQQRWERWLHTAEQESATMRQHVQTRQAQGLAGQPAGGQPVGTGGSSMPAGASPMVDLRDPAPVQSATGQSASAQSATGQPFDQQRQFEAQQTTQFPHIPPGDQPRH